MSDNDLNGMDPRKMTPEQKVRCAEIMHGTGSRQHRAAIKKFLARPLERKAARRRAPERGLPARVQEQNARER